MWDRTRGGAFRRGREGRNPSRAALRPWVERLDGRQLLTASLAPISPVTVFAGTGYQQFLDGSGSGVPSQTYTATSSNSDIKVSVAQGPFITLTVNHTPANSSDVTITNEQLTYQAFSDLTPDTTSRVNSVISAGGYNGSQIYRIVGNFGGVSGEGGFVIQGGPQAGGSNPLELNMQLNFSQPGTVAIPNGGGGNTDGTDFFVTTGPQPSLNYGYTIYGEVVAGYNTLSDLTKVATQANPNIPGETSSPINPVTISSATTSATSPSGVLHIDATGAQAGETSTITVTATDPTTNTTATQTFQVTAAALPATVTPFPVTIPPASTSQTIGPGQTASFALSSNANNVNNNSSLTTTYAIVTAPSHGSATINTTSNTLTYNPTPGFLGTDTFSYRAVNNNATSGAAPASNLGNTVTVSVTVEPTIVRVIGNVMVVSAPPGTPKQKNVIDVTEPSGSSPSAGNLVVTLNGATDPTQPAASSTQRIVVYGSKASDQITIDPSVDPTIPVTLDGGHGHGSVNVLQAGAGPTREHGWFGHNTLSGGTGSNQLVGRAGHVKFVPTSTTNEIFAGVPHVGYSNYHYYNGRTKVQIKPPGGTFYVFRNGKLHPVPTPPARQIPQT